MNANDQGYEAYFFVLRLRPKSMLYELLCVPSISMMHTQLQALNKFQKYK